MLRLEPQSAASSTAPGVTVTWRICLAGAFLVYFFIFTWQFIDPQLFYHGDMVVLGPNWWITFPQFQTGRQFFGDQLRFPGGLSHYVTSFLAQYFYFPAIGSLAITLVAATLLAGTVGMGRALRTTGCWYFGYIPPLVLLAAISAYAFPFAGFVAVALILLAILAFHVATRDLRRAWLVLPTYVLLFPLVFWTVGAVSILFALGCILIEVRRKSRPTLIWLYAAIAVGVIVAGTYIHLTHQPDEGFLFTWRQLANDVARASVPAGLYALLVLLMLAWTHRPRRAKIASPSAGSASARMSDRWFGATIAGVVLGAVSLLASFGCLDSDARSLLRANYFARTGRWPAVLAQLQEHPLPAYPPGLLYDINRALYETGQLPTHMFSFPQDPQFLIQVGETAVPYRGCQELLLRLGCVNEAEHTAYESLEVRGAKPLTLRDLAIINIVKDRPAAARVFLHVLSRDLIHGDWARDCLQRLDADPRLDLDSEIADVRAVMLLDDRVAVPPHELLTMLLERNPKNRMAFEYLMAYYLLTCQVDKIVDNLGRLQELGYAEIPQSYAEAILLDWQMTGREPDLAGGSIDPATADRFTKFLQLTQQPEANRAALAEITAGTYFDYFFAHSAAPR